MTAEAFQWIATGATVAICLFALVLIYALGVGITDEAISYRRRRRRGCDCREHH